MSIRNLQHVLHLVLAMTSVAFMVACAEPTTRPQAPKNSEASAPVAQMPAASAGSVSGSGGFMETSGVLFAFEIEGETKAIPDGGCRLKLENVRTHKDVYVSIKRDLPAVYKELEPGRYFGTKLSCSSFAVWNLDYLFGMGFDVVPGKVSYLGKVIFSFNQKEMTAFRQAPRLDSQRVLFEARAAVPFDGRSALVSGYTQKPITSAVMDSEGPESFDVYAKGTSDPTQTLSDLMSRLKRCATGDVKNDPLRIGHLTFIANYNNSAFVAFKERAEKSALSDEFVTCVDNGMRTFRPPLKSDLEVRVRF